MASNDNNQKSFTQQQEMHTKNLRGPQHLNEHADFITSQPAESKGKGADRMPSEEPNKEPLVYDPQYILQVRDLKKHFPIKDGMLGRVTGYVKAVDGVTFNLKRGTTMGLVGESGCGKTTCGRTILRLSGDKTAGDVLFNGKEVYQERASRRAHKDADHLPGSVLITVSENAGGRNNRRSGQRAQAGPEGRV